MQELFTICEHLHVVFCGLVLNFDAFLIILFLP